MEGQLRDDFRRPEFLVVDCDGHLNETKVNWKERLPKKFAELAPQFSGAMGTPTLDYRIEGKSVNVVREEVQKSGPPVKSMKPAHLWTGREGEVDPAKRVPDMDYEGIDVSVVFGALIPIIGLVLVKDPELAAEVTRAYNDWVAMEYCAAAPTRIKGIAALPMQFPEVAAKEVRRAKDLGLVGVYVWPHVRREPLYLEKFNVVWEACQDVDMPVCVHASPYMLAGVELFDRYFFTRIFGAGHGLMAACTFFCGYGILEKYSTLRVGLFEGHVGWAPWLADQFDASWALISNQLPWQKTPPSEYMKCHRIFYSANPNEKSLSLSLKYIGDDRVGFNSDYSHWDGFSPDSVKMIWTREDISDEQKRKVLGANARRFFNVTPPAGAPFGLPKGR
jgi:predicted TIM-barrel fold metal-dependent hydrolase